MVGNYDDDDDLSRPPIGTVVAFLDDGKASDFCLYIYLWSNMAFMNLSWLINEDGHQNDGAGC